MVSGSGIYNPVLVKSHKKSQVEGNRTISPGRNMAPFFSLRCPEEVRSSVLFQLIKRFFFLLFLMEIEF